MSRLPSFGPRGEGWLAAQLALIAAVYAAPGADPWRWSDPGVLGPIGAALSTAGVAIAVLAVFQLVGKQAFSPLPRPTADGRLVDTGLYARVRHPVYSGMALGGLGWTLEWTSPLAFLALLALIAVLYLKAAREEAWLETRFAEYAAYKRRTKRLIPGLL